MNAPAPLLIEVVVAGRMLALPAASIAELVHEPTLLRLPRAPAAVVGLFNLRGCMVPVVRADVLLDLEPSPPGPFRVVLVFHADPVAGRWALLVERAVAVIAGDGMVAATAGHWLGEGVVGMVPGGDGPVPVLDPHRLLGRFEARALADLAEHARRRQEEFLGGDVQR